MNSDEIKANIAQYYRYNKQCPVIAFEASSRLGYGDELADVLVITEERLLIEVEVKLSLADLKRDAEKMKHQSFRKMAGLEYKKREEHYFGNTRIIEPGPYPTHFFYFAVPINLGNDAKLICDDIYPYAGIWATDGYLADLKSYRRPKPLSCEGISFKYILRMSYQQSGTLCRLARDLAQNQRTVAQQQEELKELRQELILYRKEESHASI
ncbi:MAG: hypothetical protein PHI12_08445 [Dehalococcoidales bacterium]|nr:hypothetical protein [Dehalococcoidales bacterium]